MVGKMIDFIKGLFGITSKSKHDDVIDDAYDATVNNDWSAHREKMNGRNAKAKAVDKKEQDRLDSILRSLSNVEAESQLDNDKARHERVSRVIQEASFRPIQTIDLVFKHTDKKARKLIMQPGCYIITNRKNNRVYVGRSTKMFQRCRDHINGRGNKELFSDIRRNDPFDYALIPLGGTSYNDLRELERDLIDYFDAVNTGYNLKR